METEELYSVNIAPLVCSPFATQWSPDNQISIITERGVHVFELEPTPMSPDSTISFLRSFINPPDTLPVCVFMDEIESLIWNKKLEREQLYSLLMEEMITPKVDGATDRLLRIIKVAWSPKNLISPSQCVLAIVTAAGAVQLVHKHSNEWYSICDVSSFWINVVRDEIKSSLDECKWSIDPSATVTENIKRLQACCVTWSELFTMEGIYFAYLSVAYYNGDVSIWQIRRITEFAESLQPALVGKINSIIRIKVNVLCWISIDTNKHLLVLGYVDGRVRAIKLTCIENNLQATSTAQYVDPDYIAIDHLHVISQDESHSKILATKGSFLLLLCIDSEAVLQNMRYLQVEGFNITGLASVASEQVLIGTQDGQLLAVDARSNEQLVSANVTSHLPETFVQYLGLAQSPNKVIFLNVTSPSTVYDHLVTREPSTMHMFGLKGATWDPLRIINNSTNLGDVWDCMEMLRLKAVKAEDPATVLDPRWTLEPSSLYNLQVSMWMTIMTNVSTTKASISNIDHVKEGKLTRALPLISIHSVCTYFDRLREKTVLSKENLLAVNLLRNYLKDCLADGRNEDVTHRVRKTLNAIASYPDQIERCNLCGETINKPWYARSCSRGHKLSRCTATLLQITSLEYRVCPICRQMFHRCLEEIYEEPRCQLCDVPTLHNPYAFDVVQSQLYDTNLSQLPLNIVEPSREPEELESSSVKRQTSKWRTLHTCSIIVNNDDDESGRITEKWEEF